jgi:hypothetical protein
MRQAPSIRRQVSVKETTNLVLSDDRIVIQEMIFKKRINLKNEAAAAQVANCTTARSYSPPSFFGGAGGSRKTTFRLFGTEGE